MLVGDGRPRRRTPRVCWPIPSSLELHSPCSSSRVSPWRWAHSSSSESAPFPHRPPPAQYPPVASKSATLRSARPTAVPGTPTSASRPRPGHHSSRRRVDRNTRRRPPRRRDRDEREFLPGPHVDDGRRLLGRLQPHGSRGQPVARHRCRDVSYLSVPLLVTYSVLAIAFIFSVSPGGRSEAPRAPPKPRIPTSSSAAPVLHGQTGWPRDATGMLNSHRQGHSKRHSMTATQQGHQRHATDNSLISNR